MPISSKLQALEAYQSLPEKFRSGMVGRALLGILGLLDDEGYAPLGAVLEALFPDEPPAIARTMLATQIVNRPYSTADGSQPLQLKVSRKLRSAPATQTRQHDQKVWFESANTIDYASFGGVNPRYLEAEFVPGQALQATAQEQLQSLSEPFKAATISTQLSKRDKQDRNYGRQFPVHGMLQPTQEFARLGATEERFVASQASSTTGFNPDALGATGAAINSVNCLDALLGWASNPQAQRLVAVLGDYGTGKTSHTQQLARILNGQSKIAPPLGAPQCVYVDLAQLAGAERLNELNLLELLTLALNKQRTTSFSAAEQLVAQARAGQVILLYDGFDELIKTSRDKLHHVLQQLLMVLQPGDMAAGPSQAKVLLSCRTHYFRDADEQIAFFNTRARGAAKNKDYLCLTLLPWNLGNIKDYLGKHLSEAETDTVLDIINTTYNLTELASRPVLLAMMCEQVGELLRKRAAGEAINAAALYGITVAEWVQRDNGKHHIQAAHKPLVMGALACAMHNAGQEVWSVDQLDRWIVQTLPVLCLRCYNLPQDAADLQNDLRTATFIVRPGADQFNFAHKSFQEYFVARFVWDCLVLLDQGALSREVARALLPRTVFSLESLNFLREWWSEQAKRSPAQAERCGQWLLALMQDPTVDEYGRAPRLHGCLFRVTQKLGLTPNTGDIVLRDIPLNLRGFSFAFEQWHGLDFSKIGLDLRDANLLKLRAFDCKFSKTLCSRSNWGQSVLRDCDVSQLVWDDADRGGQMIRYGKTQQPARPLKGPWTRPVDFEFQDIAFADDTATTAVTRDVTGILQIWHLETGRQMSPNNTEINVEKLRFSKLVLRRQEIATYDNRAKLLLTNGFIVLCDVKTGKFLRQIDGASSYYDAPGDAEFDSKDNLVSYTDEAADTWLFCLATGKPEPVEMAEMVEEGYSAD